MMATLCLCMIAKNEEKDLQQLLSELKPYTDQIVLAVDHRTTDRTRDVAKKFGAQVFDIRWCDDFSVARNESLAKATMDWILVLDADERVSVDGLKKIRKAIESTKQDAFVLTQRNYQLDSVLFGWQPNDPEDPLAKGKGFTDNPLVRLFKNDRRIRFSNPVHEVVDESLALMGAHASDLGVIIHHYGQMKKKSALEGKRHQYLAISKAQIARDPANPRPYYEAGKVLKTQGRFEEAQDHFEKAAALNPAYQLVLTNLADVYAKLGLTDRAIQTYLRAIKAKPTNENAYINLALILHQTAKTDQAIGLLEKAISLNPQSATAYNNLALMFIASKRHVQALMVLKKAWEQTHLEKFHKAIEAIKPKVEALMAKTEVELRAKLKDSPDDLELVTQMGHLLCIASRFEEAALLFSQVISRVKDRAITDEKLSPLLFNLYANLSMAYAKLGRTQEAVATLDAALAQNPPHKEFFEQRLKELSQSTAQKKA